MLFVFEAWPLAFRTLRECAFPACGALAVNHKDLVFSLALFIRFAGAYRSEPWCIAVCRVCAYLSAEMHVQGCVPQLCTAMLLGYIHTSSNGSEPWKRQK